MVSVPNLAISYCIYGTMKELLWQWKYPERSLLDADREEPHFIESLICGATSGICSSIITFPIDVVRRRLQVLGLHRPNQRQGPWEEVTRVLRKEGPRGLYRGLVPELLKVTPMVGFTFCTYEFMKDLLGV